MDDIVAMDDMVRMDSMVVGWRCWLNWVVGWILWSVVLHCWHGKLDSIFGLMAVLGGCGVWLEPMVRWNGCDSWNG